MVVSDRLSNNAYRVLGLSASATLSEIHRAAATMRRSASLGIAETTEADMPVLGEVPRAEPDIRTAIGRLENPVQRVGDRLFWFHLPHESLADGPVRHSQPDGSGRGHDEALHGLLAALGAVLDDAGIAVWVRAIRTWHQVVSNDDYWALSLALEEQGAFEPPVLLSEIDALRDIAVGLAAEPLVVAARDALAKDDKSTVRRILASIEGLVDTGPWAAIAQLDIVSPALERFRELCRAVREESSSKIVREQEAGDRNKSPCDAALKRFRGEVESALKDMIQLLPPNHEVVQQAREEAAVCLSGWS